MTQSRVAHLHSAGLTNKQIAALLEWSPRRVAAALQALSLAPNRPDLKHRPGLTVLHYDVGQILMWYRTSQGLSLAEVADNSQGMLTARKVAQIEVANNEVTLTDIQKYCYAVGVSQEALFSALANNSRDKTYDRSFENLLVHDADNSPEQLQPRDGSPTAQEPDG